MAEMVMMPKKDYEDICDSVRSKTGGTALLKSGEVSPAIDSISGGGEKILYMDAELLNAGGAYPADADDYTTAVIPAEATYVSLDVFDNLPNIDTVIVNGDCEFEEKSGYDSSKNYYYYNGITASCLPLKKLVIKDRTTPTAYMLYVFGTNTLVEMENCNNIGDYGFYQAKIRSVNLNNVTGSIGIYAFTRCVNLKKIVLPVGITSIGGSAFNGCTNLVEVTLPEGLTSIGSSAFYGCSSLKEIIIPEGVTSMSDGMLGNCTSLERVTIPRSVTTFGPATLSSTVTYRVYAGSYAEEYLTSYGYTVEVIEE